MAIFNFGRTNPLRGVIKVSGGVELIVAGFTSAFVLCSSFPLVLTAAVCRLC